MFEKHVKSNKIENVNNKILLRMTGFSGCLGSSDAIQIYYAKTCKLGHHWTQIQIEFT